MWSQYDENISSNPFFKEIYENHNDIIKESSVQHWIICIPRIGSIEPLDISADVILDHIVLSLTENDEKQYYTLSKKQINIQNKKITDTDNVNNVDILFEETFYIDKITKFVVWCLDRPLFIRLSCCNLLPSRNLTTLHDCIDFLWCESLGHDLLDCIKILVCNFDNELELETLQTQKELIGILFSQCLQLCFKNTVIREKCTQNNQFIDNLKLAVETYLQYCLGRKLLFGVNTVNHLKDSNLNKIVKNSVDIQYQYLGIEDDISDLILCAKCELKQIHSYYTVLDKTECLKKTLNIIFEYGKKFKKSHVTSDDILQILVFLILKLNINNWFSNLMYLKEFRLSIESSDETLFCISSFEAALEFIVSTKFWDIKNCVQKNLEPREVAINFIETKMQLGDTAAFKNLATSSINEIDLVQGMCHPLCVCNKCLKVMQQKKNSVFNTVLPITEMTQSLLIYATELEKCHVVEFLLNRGMDINFVDCFGKTCLHYAASKGLQDIVLLLGNRQPNVNITDNEENTPLHLAALNGHENCVKALIYTCPEIELNPKNSYGDTPLILAAYWGYFDITKILLENGASITIKNKRNQTVFDAASNNFILKLCKKYSMEIDRKNRDLELDSVVVSSKYRGNCKNHGIYPRNTDQLKKIELLLKSIENNDFPLACFYLGYNSNIQTVKNGSCHPLCVCDNCKGEQLDNLHQGKTSYQNINANTCNVNGYTSLHVAAQFGRTEILRLLLDSGALPNVKTFKTLYTPLHLACMYERTKVIQELLKCGDCNVDEQDAKGNTPLYYACQNGNVKITEILVSNGADSNKKNFSEKSTLMLCEENRQYGMYKLLTSNIKKS